MQGRNIKTSLVLLLGLGLVFTFGVLPCFAEETFTITTYYPSPCGVYNELQSNRLAVGDTNLSGGLDAGDLPPANGQLYASRSVIYKPQSALPAFDAREGELVYSGSDKEFYYYNGSAWMPQGGGGGGAALILVGSTSTAPNCPTGWTEAMYGYWNCVYAVGTPLSRTLVGGDCFCGYNQAYGQTSSGVGEHAGWWSTSERKEAYYRCRICVK